MITTKEASFLKALDQFDKMRQFVEQAAGDGARMDQAERGLFPRALEMCRHLLEGFVALHGDGDEGEVIEHQGRPLQRLPDPHDKRYLSIFGELSISRPVYGTREGQAIEWAPLDAALGLPAGDNSYVLEDWQQRLCIKEAFRESVEDLYAWLGIRISVRTAEHMNRKMARYAEGFRLNQGLPNGEEDEELLVVTADGKGVPMRRPLEQRLREEREALNDAAPRGQARAGDAPVDQRKPPAGKKGKKQMAYVGAVYSIARFSRTAEQVIDQLARRERAADRPRPQHKHVWAEMTRIEEGELLPATPLLFIGMAVECHDRDPDRQKPLICVMDGERNLWNVQEEWLSRAVGILDIFHVLERLWDVAHCLHAQQSEAASEFVTHHLQMLLQGKVGYVIRNFRQLIGKHKLRGAKKKTVTSAITYFENNRHHMRYDEYLAAGYPIGSGVAEGACHHVVKDRMEGAGMRWELEGAQAVLHLRTIYLNDDWESFVTYRIENEQSSLYGQDAQYTTAI